ncbi:hypothetical protein CVT24_004122 [Panaeolus cyanescens]|uniref:Mtf2-like C-terminal domain-containing protein n=1 Tax=Panaeolus cyanescens TaxID=181874 RepID=A0A409Y660_9AGAR|nr:hypothetical protein CVT24_004122 [Panaeolus cyanescens]
MFSRTCRTIVRSNCLSIKRQAILRTYSSSDSIFNNDGAWDKILAELDTPQSRPPGTTNAKQRPSRQPGAARQSITKRETKLLSDMLNKILDNKPSNEQEELRLGLGGGKLGDLLGQLRLHRPNSRRTDELTVQEELDAKKEQMSLCEDDLHLLEWAQEHVFKESVAFEETAKAAMKKAAQEGKVTQLPTLQPPTYPHMIAALMKTFRERYRDPHLALAIFNHAQNLSIVSYVFGCSTDAYNELLETRWSCFHDMQGVLDALEEMKVNAVPVNAKTRAIVDRIRSELSQSKEHIDSNAWELLQRIEGAMVSKDQRVPWDSWKSEVATDSDDSSFDNWDFGPSQRSGSSNRGRAL